MPEQVAVDGGECCLVADGLPVPLDGGDLPGGDGGRLVAGEEEMRRGVEAERPLAEALPVSSPWCWRRAVIFACTRPKFRRL